MAEMNETQTSRRYVAVDVETTGLSTKRGDRIIEIGAVMVEGGSISREFHTLICVQKQIHRAARQVHGITEEMLIGKPAAEEVMPEFKKFIAHRALDDARLVARVWAEMVRG